ncbi:hypothetical protein FHX08_002081 [Rhizobium sp. BK529]|uniref:hypothetical protein n=1 Tax=Rhizobium sp. BK529 TaxID=2586983 RepID=UPI001610A5A7|nr:hypothetical protein [Rhizobium sp. BK529]MBB3591737.1 hypothetical protein [Rhizobium sp. BK529]
MAQVPQITVKDASGSPVDVATITALVALMGDTTANPPATSELGRLKTIADALAGLLSVNQVSVAHDVTATFTRQPNATPYNAGAVVGAAAAALTFTAAGKAGGAAALINGVSLKINAATSPATAWRLHLYTVTPPSAPSDAAIFDLPSGDRSSYLGYIDIPAAVDLGSTCYIEVNNIGKQVRLASGNCYGLLQAISGYTPGSGDVYEITLHTVEG